MKASWEAVRKDIERAYNGELSHLELEYWLDLLVAAINEIEKQGLREQAR